MSHKLGMEDGNAVKKIHGGVPYAAWVSIYYMELRKKIFTTTALTVVQEWTVKIMEKRLIDANALKERLKEYCIDGDEQAMLWYDLMGIDETIDDAPTIDAVPCWIPCEDRLPKLNEVILISNGKAVHLGYYSDFLEDVIGKKEFITKYLDAVITNAIAWMPLPDPYKRGKEDEY